MYRLLAILPLVAFVGCSSEPFDHVNVSGSVKYEDGSLIPAEQIQIIFEPMTENLDEKTYPRSGSAEVNVADGTFSEARTFKSSGIVAGKHKVLIRAFGGEYGEQLSVIPSEYNDRSTTPLEIDTAESTTFEWKIPKPN